MAMRNELSAPNAIACSDSACSRRALRTIGGGVGAGCPASPPSSPLTSPRDSDAIGRMSASASATPAMPTGTHRNAWPSVFTCQSPTICASVQRYQIGVVTKPSDAASSVHSATATPKPIVMRTARYACCCQNVASERTFPAARQKPPGPLEVTAG